LKRLFPTHDFDKNSIQISYRTIEAIGIFAIAFAASLLFNTKPDKIKYKRRLMRSHLIKIFQTNVIEHFPQEEYDVAQKILPLAVIKAKKAEAMRTIR